MNDEQSQLEVPSEDPLQFYRSLTTDSRELERDIIHVAMNQAVIPDTARYGLFRGTYRGVVKSLSGEMFYFHIPPNQKIHLVKADTPDKEREASSLLKSLGSMGFDLIKAEPVVEEEELEDEKKAAPAGGGNAAVLPPASRPESVEVATQNSQITTNHPGATVANTPEQDGSSERWHGSGHLERALPPLDQTSSDNWTTNDLMKAWGEKIMLHAPANGLDPKQRQFMIEVMGKTPNEIDNGHVKLTPYQRAQYNQWSHKSLRSHMGPLMNWLAKSRGDE